MKIISVFGSASPQAGDADYVQAEQVGRLLAKAGYAVATGAYVGTMEAVSKGAAEAGGHVIGIASDAIEAIRPIAPNRYVAEVIRYATLRERLMHLVQHNDGAIVLPGGAGTLAEFAILWNSVQVKELSPRPIVLLGDLWRQTIAAFDQPAYVKPTTRQLLAFAETPAEAVQQVVAFYE
ncbi:MAG: LOG family protein [Candidatus Promineifilaceae bacterium]